MRALAERRLLNLHDVVVDRGNEPVPARSWGCSTTCAALVKSSDTYREVIAEMLASSGYGIQRGCALHDTFLELVKEGVARGEVNIKHDAQTLADIIVGRSDGRDRELDCRQDIFTADRAARSRRGVGRSVGD